MSDEQLNRLAKAAGLSIDWVDADGRDQRVTPEVLRSVLKGLGLAAENDSDIRSSLEKLNATNGDSSLPPLLTLDQSSALDLSTYFKPSVGYVLELEDGSRHEGTLDGQARLDPIEKPGYHRLEIDGKTLTLAVAPHACPSVESVAGSDAWGLTAQLYSLRRPGDGGLGDTLALETLARNAAAHGADALGISPIHAMFTGNSGQYSPYSPSSRLFFNILHSAPQAILGDTPVRRAIESCELADELKRLESLELVDWDAVSRTRQCLLRALYDDFATGGNAQRADFDSFREAGGEALENHCRFEALHAALLGPEGYPQHWRDWPEQYRTPQSTAVEEFAKEHAEEISYYAFCQWLIARGLERAQTAARSAGMKIGLISDLAVGADGGGSQAWSRQHEVLASLSVGAPPDIINRQGQSWGISAFSPWGLKANGYRAFIEMVRANLAHAGGMRIDHVMGLMRLWVIPAGAGPNEGAYLNYPFDDLLRLLSLEAWRRNAVILGEDLGTVPDGLREKLADRNLLGMRVLFFERDNHGTFKTPEQWPSSALATSTTHDLPTINGWWQGHDIDWRIRVGQHQEHEKPAQVEERERERAGLVRLLREYAPDIQGDLNDPQVLADACGAFIARTPAPLVLFPVEDALCLLEQPNMPGTTDIHPNWRRRYPGDSATLLDDPRCTRRLKILADARKQTTGNNIR
ncbi:4-alpha-glucanotransferase [Stutzerimonas zhaodongensis]|uniref:4-alpha-glucanotransferase n=1 Tax=Stutzerimonas zhaodongensis TaxID=1176257 RepID=A0A3M2HPB3_9GAMM|nr:4-alpha-glucanotransferase [Stutzerimonas zhaodongensis]MCQ4316022.1 4-alpha-glucanotransferase [Stutzerimonas zhaodongensis]RMH89169.1 4-alpha-glucanotransferase [Stutzerimonas zhaodongensis]